MHQINVHLNIDFAATEHVSEVNEEINSLTPSEIRFGSTSRLIPHISLIMGRLRSGCGVEHVAEVVQTVSRSAELVVMKIGAPYLVGHYVLSEVKGGLPLSSLRDRLEAELGDAFETIADSCLRPHLTFAYIEDRFDEVAAYLAMVRAPKQIFCPSIEISDTGRRGTCINSLYRFALRTNALGADN